MRKILLAYVPALHQGYLNFFRDSGGDKLYLLGKDIILEFPRMERDIRAIDPEVMKEMITSLGIFSEVVVLGKKNLEDLPSKILMPDEDISHKVSDKYLKDIKVEFKPVFLRWDKLASIKKYNISPDSKISTSELDKKIIKEAFQEADKSADWWRQIGAILIKDGKEIARAHNKHLPLENNPAEMGDPRSNFDAGERDDLYTSIHAEASLIAEAAREGVSLKEAYMYVTTFPCSNCARLIASSGIKKVYYSGGYSVLDAESILKNSGVEIIRVEKENTPE